MRTSLRDLVSGVLTRRAVVDTIEATGISADTYYARLGRCAARLRDYHAWRNARLLHRDFKRADHPVRVYTDTVHVSMRRLGDAPVQILEIITSVVQLKRTWYVLAAHAGFLPSAKCANDRTLMGELHTPAWRATWDCVRHPYQVNLARNVQQIVGALPNIGRNGLFSTPYYTELAHFLVVRKMLSRFPSVHHVMDGSPALYSAALTALAKDIRERRVEIVLFQSKKEDTKKFVSRTEEDLKTQLDGAWRNMQARLVKRLEGNEPGLFDESADPRKGAQVFKHALQGAYSGAGRWAWLTFPPDHWEYRRCRVLWLTWMPGKTYEAVGRELLWWASLYTVDSAANFMRQRVRGMRRPTARTNPRRGYLNAYLGPRVIEAELWIVLLWAEFRPPEEDHHTGASGRADASFEARPSAT